MKERTTQVLLAAVALLLLAHLVRPASTSSAAHAQEAGQAPAVLRAQAIELVDKQGKVVAPSFTRTVPSPLPVFALLDARHVAS